MDVVALDTETFYSKDYSVVDLGYDRYCRHELFDAYLISVSDGTQSWAGHPRDFNFDALDGCALLSHNAAFDQEVYLASVEAGLWPKIKFAEWHCTANMASYLWNVRSLADACRIGLGVELAKTTRDRAKGKHWDDIVREGWSEDMRQYACDDATNCWRLWDKFGALWPESERLLSDLTIRQGRFGVAIDTVRLERYLEVLHRVVFTATQNLPWVARGRAQASPLGIAEECRAQGIPCPPVKLEDPEAAAEWEETYAPKYPWVMALRDLRKAKKTLATLETIKRRLRPDGTVAFSLKYAGAHTLRWAGDAGWNLQNQNKEPLYVTKAHSFIYDKDDLPALNAAFADGLVADELEETVDMRGLIVARPGHKLAPTDLAQIEPRVLNWLAGNHALLEKVATGMPIYEAHARASMGWTGGELKREDKKLYSLAKARLLGLGFGVGWRKFIKLAVVYGIDITEGDEAAALEVSIDKKFYWKGPSKQTADGAVNDIAAEETPGWTKCVRVVGRDGSEFQEVYGQNSRKIVREFRASNPLIVALWNEMDERLQETAQKGGDLVLHLPGGDKITYRDVREELKTFTDPDTGEKRSRRCCTAEIGGKRYILYGALIVENCLSGDTEVLTGRGWTRLADVRPSDLVWDGVEFVSHSGLVPRGEAATTEVRGVRATPDHRFLTERGWMSLRDLTAEDTYGRILIDYAQYLPGKNTPVSASSNCGETVRIADGAAVRGAEVRKVRVPLPVSMRDGKDLRRGNLGPTDRLRKSLPGDEASLSGGHDNSRHDEAPGVRGLAFDATAVRGLRASGVQELRGSRNLSLRAVEEVSSILEGHGTNVEARSGSEPGRQQLGVSSGELRVDDPATELPKPTGLSGSGRNSGPSRPEPDLSVDAVLSAEPRSSGDASRDPSTEIGALPEAVYDLLNCGPRRRFAVRGNDGSVFLAHNCVQRVARNVFAHNLLLCEAAGFRSLFHVHDENVPEIPVEQDEKEVTRLMSTTPEWLPGCPVGAETTVSERYIK